jgi:phosphorylcholine metabolism protein LicD
MTNQDKIREMLKTIIPVLNANGINYWMDCGTLLGIIRDKDIIEWDDDGDISYFYTVESWNKLIFCLNWVCERHGHHVRAINSGRARLYYSKEDILNEPWVDFYGWVDRGADRYTSTESGFLKTIWPYKKHIGKPKGILWKDINVKVPEFPEQRLEQLYGDWKQPKNKVPYW